MTFVANFAYPPNRAAAEWLLRAVWPRLRHEEPALRLRLVGRRARHVVVARDGVEVMSDPAQVDACYEGASVVLAPVRAGGGAQLKVTEALSRGRVVVASAYSSRAVPAAARGGVLVADDPERFAAAVLRLWRVLEARRAAEEKLAEALPLPSWADACAPLVVALERLTGPGR